jgi:hypothetical protein
LKWSHIAGELVGLMPKYLNDWALVMSIVDLIAVFGSWGDAMHNLICRCPKTQQPIDLQLYTDGVSLALIWSNPVRFQCPHCGTDHEAKVGAAHLEPLSRRSSAALRTL